MSRSTSLTFRQAINALETDQAFITFLEITNSTGQTDLSEPIRVCNDSVNITSGGNLFVAYPFDLSLPDDIDDAIPTAKITIDNVARELTEAIRSLTAPPTVRIFITLASTPNVIEIDLPYFKLSNITYDSLVIEGTISIEGYYNEPFPGDSFGPAGFPGMF